MGLQVAAAGKIINEFTGLAFAGGEFETDNPAIRFVSAEAWTRDAQGAHITFATAPIGTSSPVEGMRLTSEGILLVGTDTASGSAKLQVSGAISVSGITYAGTLALSATGANPITAATNGTTRITVTSGGHVNVGVGTVDAANNAVQMIALNTSGSGPAVMRIRPNFSGTAAADDTSVLSHFVSGIREIPWWANRNYLFGIAATAGATNYTEVGMLAASKLLVTTAGNVLINTTTDDGSSKLQVAGTSTNYGFTAYNSTSVTGITSAVIRAGAGQGTTALVTLQENGGGVRGEWKTGSFRVGSLLSTTDALVKIGDGRTGNGNSYIDFIGDATYTTYGLRLIRGGGGANADSYLAHRGTGTLYLQGQDNGAVEVQVNGNSRIKANATGIGFFGATPVVKQTVTADAASILAALQAYGLAV